MNSWFTFRNISGVPLLNIEFPKILSNLSQHLTQAGYIMFSTMSHSRTQHIGIFDSGFGGINTLRGIVQALPQYDYMYLGDTARTPYGTRSHDVIYEFTRQAIDFLFANQCDLIILACNTASSDALHKLQQDYIPIRHPGKKVLGVLIPAVEEAAPQTINKKIGVIATAGTVQSNAFPREITKINPTIQVFQQAC